MFKYLLCINLLMLSLLIKAQKAELIIPKGHKQIINNISFSNLNDKAITSSDDSTAILWEASTGKIIKVFSGHSNKVIYAKFSKNDEFIYTIGRDNKIITWDTKTGNKINETEININNSKLTISKDGSRLVIYNSNSQTQIWDLINLKLLYKLNNNTYGISYAKFNNSGSQFLTISSLGVVKIWDTNTGKLNETLLSNTDRIDIGYFCPNDSMIVTISKSNKVLIWNTYTGIIIKDINSNNYKIHFISISSDSKQYYTINDQNLIENRDLDTDNLNYKIENNKNDKISSLKLSPNGKWLIAIDNNHTVIIWNTQTKSFEYLLYQPKCDYEQLIETNFSNDGNFIYTTSNSGTVNIWTVNSPQKTKCYSYEFSQSFNNKGSRFPHTITISPDCKTFITESYQNIRIWDLSTGKLIKNIPGYKDNVDITFYNP